MVSVDTNSWYFLTVASTPDGALKSTNLYDKGLTGAVFFSAVSNPPDNPHLWQIVPLPDDSSQYVLRTAEGGPATYFGIGPPASRNLSEPGASYSDPIMISSTIVKDNRAFWHMDAWGDGTFYLWNSMNGSDLHLLENGHGVTNLVEAPAKNDSQRWSVLKTNQEINNPLCSKVVFPSTTLTIGAASSTASSAASSVASSSSASGTSCTPTSGSSASITSSPTSQSSSVATSNTSSSGLSSKTVVAIAVSISLVGVIAAAIAGIFLYRRRKRKAVEKPQHELPSDVAPYYLPPQRPSEMPGSLDHAIRPAEMDGEWATEARGKPLKSELPVELDAATGRDKSPRRV